MAKLRALVVEDDASWRSEVKEALSKGLAPDAKIDSARGLEPGRLHLQKSVYDLVVMDLELHGRREGMDLLHEIRSSRHNRAAAAVVLTGRPSEASYNQALRELGVFHFMEKLDGLDDVRLVTVARAAILDARLRQAEERARRPCLTVRFNENHVLGSDLTSADTVAAYTAEQPLPFPAQELADRANNLAYLFAAGAEVWRRDMRTIGRSIYQLLAADPRLLTSPLAALGQMQDALGPWLRFSGPAIGLGTPFELLTDDESYLCRQHLLSRQLVHPASLFSRKSQPFYKLARDLREAGEPLRILLVAANSDGKIPGAEAEVEELARRLREDLGQLGVQHQIDVLPSRGATYQNFKEALLGGRHHLLHFAGHGRRNTTLPEVGGLILRNGRKLRTLTAASLNDLVQRSELRMVFLSSCFGAFSAARPGRGDFHGVFDALAGAGVATIVGHRWAVPDPVALTFAISFYAGLWRTLSPGDAVLAARRACADEWGLDIETWASAILLMQSS